LIQRCALNKKQQRLQFSVNRPVNGNLDKNATPAKWGGVAI